jgi:hypothetical protein
MLGRAAQVEHSLDPCGKWFFELPKPRLAPLKGEPNHTQLLPSQTPPPAGIGKRSAYLMNYL